MGRRGLAIFALGLVAGCVSPPDVVIEVGETRPELSESGEGSGSGEGSAAEPWEAPGPVGQSVLAVETRPGNGWSVGTVVAPGVFVGAALGGPPTGLRWRDAAGNEGGATVLAAERSTGLYVARATALSIPPLALDFEEHAPAVRLVGHPTFGLDRGGWLSLGFARTYEDCDNGLDDDGDGVADCDDGACASVTACLGEWPEDCRNGADDDLDGLEDCEDADCRRDSRCEDTCSPARALKLPQDVGLDGAPLVDDCGRVTALVGITNRRFNTAEACAPSERASVETAAPLEPLACIGGARPEIPTVRIRALLDSVGVSTGTAADCVQDETEAVDVANAARGQSVSGTTLAMLRRARSMVYAGPGFSAVKVADPPILVAPTDALPPFNDTADSLVGIDGTTISLASSFQRPEPFSQTLSAIFYPIPTSSGFPLADREEAVAGNSYYLIGQPETLGCGAGWVVNTVRLVAFGAGDELIFEGPGYSAGAAIVTPTGGLLAVATDCESTTDETLAPASESGGSLVLSSRCAIIGSRIPVR